MRSVQTLMDRFAVPSLVRTPRSNGLAEPSAWAEGSGEGPAFVYPEEPAPYRPSAGAGFGPQHSGTIRSAGSRLESLPTMHELTSLSRAIAGETSLVRAAALLQNSARSLLRVSDATCVWIDWPRRVAMTITGRAATQVEELVIETAASGKRNPIGSALIVPIGRPPARAVLALRKPSGGRFTAEELAMLDTLVTAIAPSIDRLVVAPR